MRVLPPRMLLSFAALLSLASASPGHALAPGAAQRGFVAGANHHLGDAGLRAAGAPAEATEAQRMHAHLAHVRAWLASRPATRPELAARRAQLLGYLDEYIAAGITPLNLHLPWRNPVFVDDFGNVCAVGYLLERSEGRALVERIAAAHRYDYLEDLAMPEVQAWVAGSGFTLEELASIQPGYVAPMVEQWQTWDLPARRPHSGAYHYADQEGFRTDGRWLHGQMEGAWTRRDARGHLLGSGEFRAGAGTWRSVYVSGGVLAQGAYERSHATGAWTFFHASGRVAARGNFARGDRDGEWTFFHDDEASTPLARGSFAGGTLTGRWQHFDARGALLAESWAAPAPRGVREGFAGNAIRFRPTAEGVERETHQANLEGDHHRLDGLHRGEERLYLLTRSSSTALYDAAGHRLVQTARGWVASNCRWSPPLRAAAAAGELATVHALLLRSEENCGDFVRLAPERAASVEATVAPLWSTRVEAPEFVQRMQRAEHRYLEARSSRRLLGQVILRPDSRDLTDILAYNMGWYVEWPHIDGRFVQVFATLPDHYPPHTLDAGDAPVAPRARGY